MLTRTVIAAAALCALAACGDTLGPTLRIDAQVRVIHASPDAPVVEVILDGDHVATLTYGEVADYTNVEGGRRNITIREAGTNNVLINRDTTFATGTHYTVLAVGLGSPIQPMILRDDHDEPAEGKGRIRVVHAGPTHSPVDVYLTEPTQPLTAAQPILSDISFPAATDYLELPSGTYRLRVTEGNSHVVLIDLPFLVLSEGRVLTVVAVDTPGGGAPRGVLVLTDR